MATLLIVQFTPTPALAAIGDAVVAGAHDDALEGVDVRTVSPLEAVPDDVLAADALILGTAAHFGYMSGALKYFFDRVFVHVGGALDAHGGGAPSAGAKLPFGLWVHGRYDTTGAIRSVESITQALPWKRAAAPLTLMGDHEDSHSEQAYELGATIAALISQ
ncbi:flavodoxin [Nocardioides baekrokdamisoli]|uniref:Flavodoxin n=1 Tax=Nocardioides baekrokdamisoli TaxID=1804624 RepID=A0A3G9IXR2_9ACTN|nr:NAD(P)H-dependent oxidoreductase [Nocardioides baekrokdamisoli]BBH16078.1 flavodoxin [Nocardioides baekrokdamisoli]